MSRRIPFCCLVTGVAATVCLAAAATANADESGGVALAGQLLGKAGLSGGMVCLPRCRDAALAVALARHGHTIVQATCGDAAAVRKLAELADGDALLSQSLYAEDGSSARIPFADDYVNLLAVTDATDENLAALSAAEIVRVLAPGRGVAIVGLPRGAAGVLTTSKLTDMFGHAAGVSCQVSDDDAGRWAVVRKLPKPGAAPWTHRYFDPSNNTVSNDTACAWPLMTQWMARPYIGSEPFTLGANGRLAYPRSLPNNEATVIEVRDLHNGAVLWQRRLQRGNLAPWRTSAMALVGDALYLAEGPDVLVFDAESGKETTRVACAELGGQVKWLAVRDGVLWAMTGPQGTCDRLGAYNLSSGQWLWKEKGGKNSLHCQLVGMYGARLYYMSCQERCMVCRQAKTGEVIWKNHSKEIADIDPAKVNAFFPTLQALVCTEKAIAITRPPTGAVVLSAVDGKPLWTLPRKETIALCKDLLLSKRLWGYLRAYDALTGEESVAMANISPGGNCGMFTVTPNLWLGQSGPTYDFQVLRPLQYPLFDTISVNNTGPLSHKAPCQTGWTVAEGVAVGTGMICVCDHITRGMVTMAPAPAIGPPLADKEALRRPVSTGRAVEPLATDAADWPTLRANPERGDASSAKIPPQAEVKWSWRPEPGGAPPEIPHNNCSAAPDRLPSQATAAGDLVFVSGGDRTVTALDVKSGAVRWRFFTAGRLFAPPTIADGRCFVGAGDGRVYCLEARTGRELWRYRVAPADRRIMVYGNLLNTWPITGGVPVKDGVAYAIAGISDLDGTAVAALDAATGEVKWRNDDSGHMLDAFRRFGVAGAGYPAVGAGRLWIHNASFDLASGKCQPYPGMRNPLPSLSNGLLRRYTGMFAGNFLVTGGQRFFSDQFPLDDGGNRMRPLVSFQGGDTIEFMELKEDADDKWPVIVPWDYCRIMPAWDDRQLAALPVGQYKGRAREGDFDDWDKHRVREEDLVCWDVPRTVAALQALGAPFDNKREVLREYFRPRVRMSHPVKSTREPLLLWPPSPFKAPSPDKAQGEEFRAPPQQWRAGRDRFLAAVLTPEAVVAVWGSPAVPFSATKAKKPGAAKAPEYFVTAFSRSHGEKLWEVKLPTPDEPLMDGLSIARDGSALVRLLSGGLVAVGAK